ncbi:MAG: hypothetical protein GY811_11625 [Myxococcales bacterium]|nr:hypothetical protein [Myxococcales bacterium]
MWSGSTNPIQLSLLFSVLASCGVGQVPGQSNVRDGGGSTTDSGLLEPDTPLDIEAAQARFVTTTDIMRHVIAPTCAAENNECHSNEDFPDLHSEGNLWNLVGLGCNLGVGERDTIEDYCEAIGDEVLITSGANQGFTATIGSVETITDAEGEFSHYAIAVRTAPAGGVQTGGDFEFQRNGVVVAALGGGNSLDVVAGEQILRVTDSSDITLVTAIRQGDENRNGVYGTGEGLIVKPGDARGSYFVRRLFEQETTRVRMPLAGAVDNPNEVNSYLSANEMYVLMSWINCMQDGDGVASPIRYDCAENAGNEGEW